MQFKHGQGVRFLTQYDQAVMPINNHELFYSFQGLTGDGQFYVAAILPVNATGLPTDEQTMLPKSDIFWSDFSAYKSGLVKTLDGEPYGDFTPDFARLDAMMVSLKVK